MGLNLFSVNSPTFSHSLGHKQTLSIAPPISGPGGMITIFDKKGRIIETHPTPAERPTNCTFAHNDLYVTSIEGHLLVAKNTEFTGHLIYPNSKK